MKSAGVIALLFLAAFAAPAYVRGTCYSGNIQDSAVTCATGTDKCTVGSISPGGSANMSCSGPETVTVSFSADSKSVTFTDYSTGSPLNNINCYIKGGNGYCVFTSAPYSTPQNCGTNNNPCGFSHAVCCVPPCACADKIQTALNAVSPNFNSAGYCPGSTLPPATITVCGASIQASPAGTSDCTGQVPYTAQCPGSSTTYTTKVTYPVAQDGGFVLTPVPGGCPTAVSNCQPNGAPVGPPSCAVDPSTCKVTVTYPITGTCGASGSGTISYN